ncbi:MAG: exodeoxyribonuclease VII large subunit [Parvibaculaceae bacterium]
MNLPFDSKSGEPAAAATPNVAEFTVTEIAFALKRTLEETFGHVRVRGEISGFRGAHGSGHCYFTLKDEGARLEAVIWRTTFARVRSKVQEGLEVVATGRISSYPNTSKYQIVIESIEPAGVGALMALIEERKRKLQAEGLFDAARKKPIPYLPAVIAVVTSPTGAVIRDILHRLADRFPRRVLVWPVRVQGEACAPEVAAAIQGLNALASDGPLPRPDLIIVARGGGSLEDLWGFNDEAVVRAAAASAIPLISAVGHETDWTLIDYAADERAPTPTAAAERAVPVRSELVASIADCKARLTRVASRLVSERRMRVLGAARALPRPDDVLALARQRHDAAAGRLVHALKANLHVHRLAHERCATRLTPRTLQRALADGRKALAFHEAQVARAMERLMRGRRDALAGQGRLLDTLSYKAVLKRGYAVVRDESGRPVRTAGATAVGQPVGIEFQDGRVDATIGKGAAPSEPLRPRRKAQPPPGGGQGSLF